ncbi:MAG: S8 family serine peptidase, partial [Bdellovibrionales bacterium]
MKLISFIVTAIFSGSLMAENLPGDMLVKISPEMKSSAFMSMQSRLPQGTVIEDLGIAGWMHVKIPASGVSAFSTHTLANMPGVLAIHGNHIIKLNATWQIKDPAVLAKIKAGLPGGGLGETPAADNPPFPTSGSGGSGADPLTGSQWGMNQMGVRQAWGATKGNSNVIVAVIDTGVDYTHEDLVDNIWHNPGEIGKDSSGRDKSSNSVDDDSNGYIDDVIGWDFASNDNRPFDLTAPLMDQLMSGGNPGHGTHCAGNVAARADNGKGITGVAPGVNIMPLRFITDKGQGTTADAIKAIRYAVMNGAKVMSNSWGSEGDDPADKDTQALKDAITFARDHNVLFVAAAGNGHSGVGYDNDSDSKPGVPASYAIENII